MYVGGRRSAWARAGAFSIIVIGMLALWAAFATPARADTTIAVSATAPDTTTPGGCSLREAIAYAAGTSEPDCAPGTASGTTTIRVPAMHYVLTQGVLSVSGTVVIEGAGAAQTLIDGNSASQVFSIASAANVTISGVTVEKGNSGTTGTDSTGFTGVDGGGIANAGTLSLQNVVVSGNVAGSGAPACFLVIFGGHHFCLTQSGAFGGDGGRGGGIYNKGTLTVSGSTVVQNIAGSGGTGGTGASSATPGSGGSGGSGGGGGGLFNDTSGIATVTNSLLSDNTSGSGGNGAIGGNSSGPGVAGGNGGFGGEGGDGGGIENWGNITVTASTVSQNKSGAGGAGAAGGTGDGASNGFGAFGGDAGNGGGYDNDSSSATKLTNVTLTADQTQAGGTGPAGNGSNGSGGAVNQYGSGLVALTFDTVASNSAVGTGGGINTNFGGVVTEANTIASGNSAATGRNCNGANITDDGFNLVFGDNSCPGRNGDPKLGALTAGNGGPTPTMALGPGSAAIGLVPVSSCGTGGSAPVDERGISRPQGTACDAGAYEVAPPSLSSPGAAAVATTAGIVSATLTPHLRDTTVTVRFGTTSAYGSTTSTQDLGSGNAPVAFAAPIGGLTPGTTYHAQIVATNGDGTTTSGDLTFTTPDAVGAAVGGPVIFGSTVSTTITCSAGNPGDVCSGPVTLTAHETRRGATPVAISAVAAKHKPGKGKGKGSGKAKGKHKKKKKPKRPPLTTTLLTLASSSYSITTGHSETVTLSLNSTGQALLNRFYRLPATLSVGGTVSATEPITFQYGRLHISPVFTFAFFTRYTKTLQLTVSPLPPQAKVLVICHGGGCPFARRTFAAKRGKLNLEPSLKGKRLRPHATLQLQITAPGDVGEVVTFTIIGGKSPTERFSCLPPGSRAPAACAT